jgi:hypothetical protein
MAYERPQFRIIPDPKDPSLWAYERLAHDRIVEPVGGFRTPKEARKAFERQWRGAPA